MLKTTKPATYTYLTPEWDEMVPFPASEFLFPDLVGSL